jgi:hypothetical protein
VREKGVVVTDLSLIPNQQVKILLESSRTPVIVVNVRGDCVCGRTVEGEVVLKPNEPLGEMHTLTCFECGRIYTVSEQGNATVAMLINHINIKP